ncbi:Putative ferredoxin (fragment) [Thiomonas sp. X19]
MPLCAAAPVVVQVFNAVNKPPATRALLENALGADHKAWLPELASKKFRSAAPKATASQTTGGERTPGKVAIFSTCSINANEPGIGLDLFKGLEHNGIAYELVNKEQCRGMPKQDLGDLDGVARAKEANIPVLAKYAHAGYAILTGVPSCTLMFKQDLGKVSYQIPCRSRMQNVGRKTEDMFKLIGQSVACNSPPSSVAPATPAPTA